MKKALYFFLFIFLLFPLTVSANWYNKHTVDYTSNITETWCPDDGDTIGGSPTWLNEKEGTTYTSDVRVTSIFKEGAPVSGVMTCEQWDGVNPIIDNIKVTPTSDPLIKKIFFTISDSGGAGIKEVRTNTNISASDIPVYTGELFNLQSNQEKELSYIYHGSYEESYKPCIQVIDWAGNSSGQTCGNEGVTFLDDGKYWYNRQSIIYGKTNKTDCPLDGDTTGGQPFWRNTVTGGRYYDSKVTYPIGIDKPEQGEIICYMYDKYDPSIKTFTHTVGWTNTMNQNIAVTISDAGGASVKNLYAKKSKQTTIQSVYTGVMHELKNGAEKKVAYTYTGENGEKYKPCGKVKDYANNQSTTVCSDKEIYFDNEKVVSDDILVDVENTINKGSSSQDGYEAADGNVYIVANDSKKLYIKIKRSASGVAGSGISKVYGTFEGEAVTFFEDTNLSNGENYDGEYSYFFITVDVSEVDTHTNFNPDKGYTDYTVTVNTVEDRAGNVSTINKDLYYYVYANTTDTIDTDFGVFDTTAIADGTANPITFTLKDKYNNAVVPVTSSTGEVIRKVTLSADSDNEVQLDQYNVTGVGADITAITNIGSSTNGRYQLKITFYSPTYSGTAEDGRQYVQPDQKFTFKNVVVSLDDKAFTTGVHTKSKSFNKDIQAKPWLYTEIGDSIESDGLIAGTQSSEFVLQKNGSTSLQMSDKKVYPEFGTFSSLGLKEEDTHYDLQFQELGVWKNIANGLTPNITLKTPLGFTGVGLKDITTMLTQKQTVETAQRNYLATHISIEFPGGKKSLYSSYTYGMGDNNYYLDSNGENTYQRGVKVLGNVSSMLQQDLVTNQGDSDTRVIADISHATFRSNIRKNVSTFVRSIGTVNSVPKTITSFNVLKTDPTLQYFSNVGNRNEEVFYFKNLGEDSITINLDAPYKGIKTIVVDGGNVYITKNIFAENKKGDILGIIVLEDESGNGGNIFIDPEVEEIDALLYANNSVLSGTGINNILSPEKGGTYTKLKKQLYVYGAVLSRNTLGGSKDPTNPVCPYYIEQCTLDTARAYDLNYLRRAKNNLYNSDWYTGNYKFGEYSSIIEYNPLIMTKTPYLFQNR